MIHGCYQKKKGNLRLVPAGKRCSKGEKAIAFNQQGRQGPPGTSGTPGTPGTRGTPGVPGAGIPFTLGEVDALDSGPSITSGDLAHPGPQVTVTVPVSGLVEVYAQADMSSSMVQGVIDLYEDGSPVPAWTGACYFIATRTEDPTSRTHASAPGVCGGTTLGAAATSSLEGAGAPVVITSTPGTHTFKLQYRISGAGNAAFANRKLWVAPRP